MRENCHLLGEDARGHALRPDFRVLDENEAQVLRERVLARTLDDFYGRLTTGGTLLADTLGAGRDDSALEDLVLELHAKLQAQPYEDKWLDAQRAFWRAVPDKIEDTPYGKILLNEVRRKARHCKNLLQRAAQEMCANDALIQKYAPAFLDASYQLEALEGKTAEGWDAARGVTIAFPRLAAVKDSDGGEMKARMKSLWDNCKETVKGFAEIFSASSDEAVEDLRTMASAMLALIDLTAGTTRKNGGGILLTSPIRSTRPSAFSSERTARRQSLRASSARATARSWWTSIRTPTRCRIAFLTRFLVKGKTFSLLAMSSRASIASA